MNLSLTVPEVVTAVLLLAAVGTPVAVTSYLLAEKFGADAQAAAGLVTVSTLIYVGALPLLRAVPF